MVFRINLAIRCDIFFIKFYFDLLNLHTFFFELIHDFYILCCHAFFSLCDMKFIISSFSYCINLFIRLFCDLQFWCFHLDRLICHPTSWRNLFIFPDQISIAVFCRSNVHNILYFLSFESIFFDHCLISDLYLIRHAKIFIRSCFLSFFRTHCWNRTIFQCKWCYDLITSSTWIKCDLTLRCNVFPTRYNRYGSWYDLDPFCLKFILNLQISHKSSRIWIGDHCLISYMISFFIKLYWSWFYHIIFWRVDIHLPWCLCFWNSCCPCRCSIIDHFSICKDSTSYCICDLDRLSIWKGIITFWLQNKSIIFCL